ncbi:MAG: S8 family peptidase [Nocardioidaceae bacterium]
MTATPSTATATGRTSPALSPARSTASPRGVEVVAVRVLGCDGRGPFSQVIAGVDWVTSHAASPAVANMSIGGKPNRAVDEAVTTSIDSGIPYSIAAGNDSADACNYSPARTRAALTVGATDKTDTQASFSNLGRCLDLYAPGVLIRSAWPSNTGVTNTISGTSFAAPHVAGTVALYLEQHPAAPPSQVRQSVVGGATSGRLSDLGPESPDKLVYSRVG